MTKIAPNTPFGHYDQHIPDAGGTLGDSTEGTIRAANAGYHRIDNNGDAVRRGVLGLYPVNAHGKPFLPSYIKTRFTDYRWGPLHAHHPALRDARKTFEDAKTYLGPVAARKGTHEVVEWEVKDIHPYTSQTWLKRYFRALRRAAKAVWGADWKRHVVVKVLTNLRGGLAYAKHVLQAASAIGFDTMILARGAAARRVINEPYITWNRGGKVA